MDLIHATYLFLLGLGLLCIFLLCFYLKPDLVVAVETVKSQHRQDLMSFTKRIKKKRKGKAKPIHFIIRWSQLFYLALALFYLTCQVFMECHPCVWNCAEHKITKMPGGLSGKWLASTPSLMKWHILRDAYHVCVCCLIFWHVLQLTLGNLFFGTPSRQSCSIWTRFKSDSQIINNRQGVKNVSLPAGGLWWEITCARPSK